MIYRPLICSAALIGCAHHAKGSNTRGEPCLCDLGHPLNLDQQARL
jgi:hypothetical protein